MPAYTDLGSLSANQVLTAPYLNSLNDNLRVISVHDHSGSAGDGASSVIVGASGASPYVNRMEVIVWIPPSANNFNTVDGLIQDYNYVFGGYHKNISIPASMQFPISIFAGTYTFQIMHEQNTNMGIASLLVGGCSWGEIDFYASAQNRNVLTTLTGSIPTSGSYTLNITASGKKNALSSSTNMRFQAWKIRKTGGY